MENLHELKLNELEELNGGGGCDWAMLITSTAASAGYGAAVGLSLGDVGIIGCGK